MSGINMGKIGCTNGVQINYDGGQVQFFLCPVKKPREFSTNDHFDQAYSMTHAEDQGWRSTRDIKYCEPGTNFALICPDCARRIENVGKS